jgi:LysR family hydrogen peroxide-inducible transcriptional activator
MTPVGAELAARARQVLAACDAIEELARTHRDPLKEPVTVGIISTVAPSLVARLVPALREAMPRLTLIVREGLTADLLTQLDRGKLDAVVAALPITQAGVTAKSLFREPFWFACPPGHPLASKRRIRASDLAGHTILLLSEGHCLRDQALALCRRDTRLTVNENYRATSLETLTQLVSEGFGCTFLPALARRGVRSPNAGALCTIPFASPDAYREVALVWRLGYPRAAMLEELAAFIRTRSAAWLEERPA